METILRWLFSTGCPNCDGDLVSETGRVACNSKAKFREELGLFICERCSVVVSYRVCGWRFPLETKLRPLPGVLGLFFRKPKTTEEAA